MEQSHKGNRVFFLPPPRPSLAQEYEDIAVRLGNDISYRKAIRAKVWKSRTTSTLFDTKNYAKEIEGVFTKIWQRHAKGLPPDHIVHGNGNGNSPDILDKVKERATERE